MARIIITESQLKHITTVIKEEIQPSEAYEDASALQTVLDGKRGLCFLSDYDSGVRELLKIAQKAGLKFIKTPQTQHKSTAYIVYKDGFGEDAMKLHKIVRANGGYLPINTPEETYEIGILLGYNEEAVRTFVQQKFPSYKFH